MKDFDSSLVHSSWKNFLRPHAEKINRILAQLDETKVAPTPENIFRAFRTPLESIRCVIVGQDPYPTPGYAHGLAFSVDEDRRPFPKSLQNIFAELTSDLGIPLPDNGNLERWSESGVMLLNRVLTVELGKPNAHLKLGWQEITNAVAEELAKRDVVAVLWGKNAQELSNLFQYKVESPHPSPLSAYRGFFGSRPFSTVNNFLLEQGKEPIHW